MRFKSIVIERQSHRYYVLIALSLRQTYFTDGFYTL
nr:MAG TPA: hypothetical protein [Bacteriophage sp.]